MNVGAGEVRSPGAFTLAEAFDPRANSIGFLRWLMAFLVIFSHAGPLAGFYGGHDLGTQLSDEQSLGGVAVAGFFYFSGFLITESGRGRSSVFRFFWRRCLRILPAFWTALLITVFVFAPLAWRHEHGTLSGYWHSKVESPLTYVWHNVALFLNQRGIAGLGDNIPYGQHGHDWNGSAWTLKYEFTGYLLIGVLAVLGVLVYRRLATLIALFIIVVNAITWIGLDASRVLPYFSDIYVQMLLAPFAFGILFALWADRIPIDDRLAFTGLAVAVVTYNVGGWNIFGQFGLMYALMWAAVRATKLRNWERFGDFSYGIYIFAWPLMQLAAHYGLQKHGMVVYFLAIVTAVHLMAFLSWHLVENPAMALKDWTPRALLAITRWVTPVGDRVRSIMIDPRYSSVPPRKDVVSVKELRPHTQSGLRGGPIRYVALIMVVAVTLALCVVGRAEAARLTDEHHRVSARTAATRAACRPPVREKLPDVWGNAATAKRAESVFQRRTAKSNAIIKGRDGWVFWGDLQQDDLSQGLGRSRLSQSGIRRWVRYFTALNKEVTAAGGRFYVVVAPSKWDVYPTQLPTWARKLRGKPRNLDLLLKAAPNLPFIDTRSTLRASATATYSPLNSHWTPYGAALAWNKIAQCASSSDPSSAGLRLPEIVGATATADVNEFGAFGVTTPSGQDWTTPTFASPLPEVSGSQVDTGQPVPAAEGVDLSYLPATTSSPSAPVDQTLLLLRDSTGNALSQFADATFRRTIQVRHPMSGSDLHIDVPNLLGQYHPAVTIFLMTERYLALKPHR